MQIFYSPGWVEEFALIEQRAEKSYGLTKLRFSICFGTPFFSKTCWEVGCIFLHHNSVPQANYIYLLLHSLKLNMMWLHRKFSPFAIFPERKILFAPLVKSLLHLRLGLAKCHKLCKKRFLCLFNHGVMHSEILTACKHLSSVMNTWKHKVCLCCYVLYYSQKTAYLA